MDILALVVIALTLVGVAVGRWPWLRMNRATIAFVGANAVVALGALPLSDAYAAVDLDTLVLLLSMMILNANLRIAGFFDLAARRLGSTASRPLGLLFVVVFLSGTLSALFLNDTVVLALTPLLLEVTRRAKLPPIPYLIATGAAANVGSVATIIGNPQNILIGASSGIPFVRFAAVLGPLSLVCLLVVFGIVALVYRDSLRAASVSRPIAGAVPSESPRLRRSRRPLRRKCLMAVSVMGVLLVLGLPVAFAASIGASLLLVTRRLRPQRVFREIDVSLLVFFAGLFVVTRAFERSDHVAPVFAALARFLDHGVPGVAAVGAILSNLVSNVPAVLLLRPAIVVLEEPESAWLGLAMATTFAGNLTLLGSVANLIVAESAAREGVRLGFAEYLRAGVPITLATLACGTVWLQGWEAIRA